MVDWDIAESPSAFLILWSLPQVPSISVYLRIDCFQQFALQAMLKRRKYTSMLNHTGISLTHILLVYASGCLKRAYLFIKLRERRRIKINRVGSYLKDIEMLLRLYCVPSGTFFSQNLSIILETHVFKICSRSCNEIRRHQTHGRDSI